MSTWIVQQDMRQSHYRTRRTMVMSLGIHTLLVLWIVLGRTQQMELANLTEITMVEPGDLEPAAPAAPAAMASAPAPASGLLRSDNIDEQFRRESRTADVKPDPQSDFALSDQIASRLNALQRDSRNEVPGAAVVSAPTALWSRPASVTSGSGGAGTSPVALTRGGTGGGSSLELSRGLTPGGGTSLTAAAVRGVPGAAEAAPASGGESTARRTLAGAQLAGPIANRAVLTHVTPVYPEWAKREGVEGSVTLYFVVRPDGAVKENVLVQKLSGFEDFDESARTALRAWRFEPLRGGRTGEQWGTITFHFRLRESG